MLGLRSQAAPLLLHGRLCELAARRFPWLCLVTDTKSTEQRRKRFGEDPEVFYKHIYQCMEGGVDMLHFRDRDLLENGTNDDFLHVARRLHSIAQRFDVPLILNDNPEVALELGCWVHFESTSKVWTPEKIKDVRAEFDKKNLRQCAFGYSINVDNLNDGPYCQDADWYMAQPIFKTIEEDFAVTKKFTDDVAQEDNAASEPKSSDKKKNKNEKNADTTTLLGLDGLEVAMNAANGDPVIAVGGITQENAQDIMKCGSAGVCVVGELMDSKRPTDVAKNLKELMMKSACGNIPKSREGRSITEILNARRTMQMGKPGGRTSAAGKLMKRM